MVAGAWIVCLPKAHAGDVPADKDVARMLKGVEERYNHTETLEVSFAETFTNHGRKHTEQGELYLRKPGRTRWEYKIPQGKLFGSDGKFAYAYFPDEKRFDKMSLKETDDMRAPLAFLLGKLQFDKEFRGFRTQEDGPSTFITATPKSDKMPYSEVTFLIDPNFTIRWINVKGQDGSQLEFAFSAEKRNPPIAEAMFKFTPPPGVIYTDLSQRE
ncbi:MAG TPA: outer membrane lipoprotein carrier protein LolA [Bryobacteraceae bacterium]|jgi:outer membrane lipoprotein carrier protein|nr:outer membrane lipoprotein carrier protein LolA [Bryobacteraceae bacterium]